MTAVMWSLLLELSMYTVIEAPKTCVCVNVYAFLNLCEVPVSPNRRTGNQQAIFRLALSWGRRKSGPDLTVVCYPHKYRQVVRVVTLTRGHSSYAWDKALVKTSLYSCIFWEDHGGPTRMRASSCPWSLFLCLSRNIDDDAELVAAGKNVE